jgi:thiamine biosynthesis lipoprotein
MNRIEITSLVILILVIAFGVFKYLTRSYTEEKSQYLMDTIVKISATSKSKDVGKKIGQVFEYIKRLETDLDEYKEGGWLYHVNNTNEYRYPMQPDVYRILLLADSLYRFTEGRFDITIKPVFDLWQFSSANPQIPDDKLIKQKLKQVGFDKLRFDEDYLYKPYGMQLTLGALAKGYILDRAKEYMLTLDLYKGYIDCHSSMIFYGNSMLPELVGIQHPRNNSEVIATIQVKDTSVSTTGDYQQYFEYDGSRYHHILDAHTGYPVKNMYSVTVLNPSALFADGLSTAIFLMDPEEAINRIKEISQTEAIIYYQKNNTIMSLKSQGIKSLLQSEKIQ